MDARVDRDPGSFRTSRHHRRCCRLRVDTGDNDLPPKVPGVVTGIGSALLAGGIFASITKTMQLSGVFREELENVVFGRKHLKVRSDVKRLWRNATRSLCGSAFEEIDEALHKAIVERFLIRRPVQ